jgi:hypothetical protein
MEVRCWFKISPFKLSYVCCYTIPLDSNNIIDKVKNIFPFEGSFNFQLKVWAEDLSLNNEEFVWVNAEAMLDDDVIEMISTQSCLDVLISPKSDCDTFLDVIWHTIPIVDNGNWVEDTQSTLCGISKHIQSNNSSSNDKMGKSSMNKLESHTSLHSEQSSSMNLKIVKNGAVNLWKTITKATAEKNQIHNIEISVSNNAIETLGSLSNMVNSTFNYDNPDHQGLLQNLWNIQILPLTNKPTGNSVAYLKSTEWKLAGWQNPSNICIDLKTSGLLSIHSMIYFGQTYRSNSLSMLEANQQNSKYLYPYAIVAINLTLLLVDVFHLRDKK